MYKNILKFSVISLFAFTELYSGVLMPEENPGSKRRNSFLYCFVLKGKKVLYFGVFRQRPMLLAKTLYCMSIPRF